jgi:hypothetical protein
MPAVFTRFATNSKTRKHRFFERFYGLSGGAEARLAWISGLVTGAGKCG